MRAGRLGRSVVALIATSGMFAACSSSAKPTTAGATTTSTIAPTTTATTTTTRPACHLASGYRPGTEIHHVVVAGVSRDFLVHLPPQPKGAMRLVVDFHGAGSNMQQQDFYSGFDPIADRDGFVVATPNGIDGTIRQWRFLGTRDDVDFAVAIVRTLVRNACVDAAHAYATGISSGGAMTASLACQAADTFAGFAPVAADFYFAPVCGKARQRPIMIFHGTADPVVPYKGGHVGTGAGLPVGAAETTAADWARHNGCAPGPVRTRRSSEVERLGWRGCTVPVVMYSIVGGGHTWPGAIDVARLGTTTHQINASTQMLQFFAAKS